MLNKLIMLIALCGLVLSAEESAQPDSMIHHRYPIKSCIVEFELDGMQTGKETLYFEDYGLREAKYSQTSLAFGSLSTTTNTLTLMDREWIYNIDLGTNSGTKIPNPVFITNPMQQVNKDLVAQNREMMSAMGGKLLGEEEYLNKKCEVWSNEALHSKTWIWNGIVLKSIVNTMGMKQEVRAVKIQDVVKIPPEKFLLPKDVKLTEKVAPDKMLKGFKPQFFEE